MPNWLSIDKHFLVRGNVESKLIPRNRTLPTLAIEKEAFRPLIHDPAAPAPDCLSTNTARNLFSRLRYPTAACSVQVPSCVGARLSELSCVASMTDCKSEGSMQCGNLLMRQTMTPTGCTLLETLLPIITNTKPFQPNRITLLERGFGLQP